MGKVRASVQFERGGLFEGSVPEFEFFFRVVDTIVSVLRGGEPSSVGADRGASHFGVERHEVVSLCGQLIPLCYVDLQNKDLLHYCCYELGLKIVWVGLAEKPERIFKLMHLSIKV